MPRLSTQSRVAAYHARGNPGVVIRSCYLCQGMVVAVVILGGFSLKGADNSTASTAPLKPKLSERIIHEVETKLPKYNPPPKTANETPPAAEETPASPDVLRLPKVTVTADAPTPPPDWAMVTTKERLQQAIKARPGIKIGNLFGLNNGYALEMQWEERNVQKQADLKEIVDRTGTDNSAESRRVDQLLKAALARPTTGWVK